MKMLRNLLIVGAVAAASSLVTTAYAGQGHMDAAIGFLQQAREQLQQASPDKGGWRVKAIADIDAVIVEIQNGKAAAQ